jgi:hypothetical protein
MAAAMSVASVSCTRIQESPFEKDLQRIDEVISHAGDYMDMKEQQISTIENMLHSRGVTPLQQYHIYGELYDEYVAYQFDKAKSALDSQLSLADELGEVSLKYDAMIKKAHLLTTAGYYHEADALFGQIDTTSLDGGQMVDWYMARQKFLSDYNEYVSSAGFTVGDFDKIPYYQAQIVRGLPDGSYYNRHIEILSLIFEKRYREANELNLNLIESLDKSSRDYAVQTYWQGFICENLDRTEEIIKWWTESALCDIRGAIKDNASLCSIAIKLSDPQDTDRAFRYINISLDDALFYNAKLRKVQIASTLPWIIKTYTDSKELQSRYRSRYLIMTTCIALLLLVFCVVTIRLYVKGRRNAFEIESKNRQLAEYYRSVIDAEENLKQTNLDLVEANAAKEEYLGLFLSMCSGYLDKLKKNLTRDQFDAELKNFYKTFDTSFLTLYPTFVEEFNALLKEDSRVKIKDGELLSTELRIFALIKLGITQSSHIASLLRYSVNTIYNYRAQVKNAALENRGNFEETVRKIGSKR